MTLKYSKSDAPNGDSDSSSRGSNESSKFGFNLLLTLSFRFNLLLTLSFRFKLVCSRHVGEKAEAELVLRISWN
ncbi:hypothetical protein P8452_78127 [Trifolium repens]|nr:hypothetical protein P8452_78127 [Trifolium repens]